MEDGARMKFNQCTYNFLVYIKMFSLYICARWNMQYINAFCAQIKPHNF